MRTPNVFLIPCLLLAIACGDDAGSATADASATADGSSSQPDASLTDPDASTGVPDASTALADAAIGAADAGSADLSQLVDDIVDSINNVGAALCACDASFCGIIQVDANQRACMQGVISGQLATGQLQSDLLCAADGLAVAETCVGNQSCDQDGMFACLDSVPACVESPLFAQGFEDCLDESM